jgi:tRNA dimethylallyltransferase
LGDKRLPVVTVIYGPTAVGKTTVAIEIAEKLGGEIVSCDSRQIFKHLDIGTAKPTEDERRRARFHLIDVIPPDRFLSAFEFRQMAEQAIDGILARGSVPIMTVGTGFYLKAMTDGIFEAPSDEKIRAKLEDEAGTDGSASLYERLKEIDPQTASGLSENDSFRIIRALELYELTGMTRSDLAERNQLGPSPYRFVFAGLTLERSLLYDKIDRRCEAMIETGLVDEARTLRENGILLDEIAAKIVGYAEVIRYLDGLCDNEMVLADFQQATRNYAKRQVTWFRKHPGGRQFGVESNAVADNLLREFESELTH